MDKSITNVQPDNVPALAYAGQPVVTTAILADLYGTEQKRIQNNYRRNAGRFESGKHFFKVEGEELSDLRPSLRGSQISAKARSIILWTERGAARHAKMLETDQAWDVFEALEDHYFGPRQAAQYQALPSPLTPGHQRTLQRAIARRAQVLPEIQRRAAYARIYSHLKDRFEVASYKDIDDSRFTEALGAVESVSLEGELLTAAPRAEVQDSKRQAEYLMGHHLLWAIHYWREYNVEAALRALGSPAAARIGEHLRVAGVHGRTLLRSHPELLTLAEERLTIDVI